MIENENMPTTPRPITPVEDKRAETIDVPTLTDTENADPTIVRTPDMPDQVEQESAVEHVDETEKAIEQPTSEAPPATATAVEQPVEVSTDNVSAVQQDSEAKEVSPSTPALPYMS